MASLCKSQQCSIERRGFRQELDSWRYKLIHCVGFESILEGLFGPGLLNDLSLFKDCEPTGVCDWSFDENCLFCCLRREKVKEHLAGLNKSVSEPGQENLLKQEQAKIIRLERQAEEFINAVFYKKDSPRISDPNIPLVAREIMQRMIRQFAAEYTSKNSSTQDSSQPNSTKNQSLPKSPSGQSSPPPATTQNPVLSKLLMADQDSPLDLTVKKPQSEEPCEQDGVLDLSTKKSPCSGSTHSSISPSTSNAIGNGTQKREREAVVPCSTTIVTLEKFMVKLCAHHQNQFLRVLNILCTEKPIINSKSQSASILDFSNSNMEGSSHYNSDQCTRKTNIHSTSIETSINPATVYAEMEDCPRQVSWNMDILKSPIVVGVEDSSKMAILKDCISPTNQQEENITKNHILHVNTNEENTQLLQSDESGCTKKMEHLKTEFPECCILSHCNLTLAPVTSAQEAEFFNNLPKCADKENAQCISPRQTSVDKDSDCKLKQNSEQNTVVVTKRGIHVNHYESFLPPNDNSESPFHKIRLHENFKHSKTPKRCKNTPCLRKSDCDNQCDVVYITEPITAPYHFQQQKSFPYSRYTARKSTRGCLFGDEYSPFSTVRTLVRNSKVEDKGNSALHFAKALINSDGVIADTLPLTNDVSLVHSEETCVGIGTVNSLPQHGMIQDLSICKKSENTDEISGMVEQPVNERSDSLLAVFSLVRDGNENPSFSGPHPANEVLQTKPDEKLVQMDNLLDARNIHRDHLENATPMSLEKILHSEHNNVDEVAANEFSQKPTVEQMHVPLSNSPSTSCSVFPLSNEIKKYRMSFTTPYYTELLRKVENSIQMFKNCDISPVHLGSNTIANGTMGKTFEDLNYLNPLEENTKEFGKGSSNVTRPIKTETFQEDYIEQSNADNCSVHVEPIGKIEFKKLETEPSKRIDCLTNYNHVNRIYNKDVDHLIDTCAKICERSDLQLKERSVTKDDIQQCHSVISFKHDNNVDVDTPSQTKEINGEKHSNTTRIDTLDNLLPSNNTNSKSPMPLKRKLKKTPIPTDRRLRSRETQTDMSKNKKASLQVQISQFGSMKSPHRSVEFSTDCATPYGLLTQIIPKSGESLEGENCCVQFLSNQFAEEKTLLSERMFKNTSTSTPKRVENVSVNFEISSDQRKVFLCSKSKNSLKVEDEESICSQVISKNDCPFKSKKCNKQMPADTSVSLARTRSKTKCTKVHPLTESKEEIQKAKLEHLSAENGKPFKKSLAFTDMDNSLHSLEDKEMIRPKFIDWYYEEKSQERVSIFNNKYSSVHNNWISLEKDGSVGPKSKSKADKLKEIWKTKKRARKAKSMEETQRYSPIQMLFMNSFKISDICKWFLETTETKSLVITKKLNTRFPEEHQLPFPPVQRHPSPNLYPHTLQAERLKKHLKKFASAYPACNNAKTQNALSKLENGVQLVESSKILVKAASNSKYPGSNVNKNKTTSARILRKYNNFREKLHHPSAPLNKKHQACIVQNSASKIDPVQNNRLPSSKLNSQTVANSPAFKLVQVNEKQKARKRPKDDQSAQQVVQPSKKRKIKVKPQLDKNRHKIPTNLLTIKVAHKVKKTDGVSQFQASKRQEVKVQAVKASALKKGKTKTPKQKKSSKTQLVIRNCQTRSSKQQLVPSPLSEQRIPRMSQPLMKERHRKRCTSSKVVIKNPHLEKRKNRSRTDSSTQSKR
ncbi:ligand-dependent corepressor isoform X2 [Pyxicephalus adspersus]|uniref:ligand-dependent corepressor isoform X2 n=1 Tax=Pyxicephalus adspersus TaxID=30357 RepID=UPI003B5B6B90